MSVLTSELPSAVFAKQDTDDDLALYGPLRLVTHIDEDTVVALTLFYRDVIPAGVRALDLMSSRVGPRRRILLRGRPRHERQRACRQSTTGALVPP